MSAKPECRFLPGWGNLRVGRRQGRMGVTLASVVTRTESAPIIPVPAAEAVVGPWRENLDPACE